MAASKDFQIHKGKTFFTLLRWEAEPMVYKAITGITRGAPARLTVAGHGIPDAWRVAVVSVKGMSQINAANSPPKPKDYSPATVVDVNTIELNGVNSSDFNAYTSGGYVQFKTPVDLAGMTGRIDIKDKIGGRILASTQAYTIKDDQGNDVIVQPIITVVFDNVLKTITVAINAADTAAVTWKKGVYELEILSGSTVTLLLSGSFTVREEVPT